MKMRLIGVLAAVLLMATAAMAQVPAPWTPGDVGAPTMAGSASVAGTVFTVNGAGADIWGTADQFQFVSQPLVGNGEIVARVDSLVNTNTWAKAGVMIREDRTAGAPNAFAYVSPGAGMIASQRTALGGATTSTSATPVAGAAPYWVRLVRNGTTFTTYTSATGTGWVQMGTTTVPMATNALVGLAVTSLVPTVATAGVFSNVTVTQAAPQSDITATSQLQWDEVAATLAEAQGFSYAPYVDNVKRPALVETCVTSPTAGQFTCNALVPPAALVVGTTPTTHSIDLTATNTGGLESAHSASITVTILPTAPPVVSPTTTTLVMTGVSPNLTFTATVASAGGIPTGTLTFRDNGVSQGTRVIGATGTGVWVAALTAGAHLITADYGGAPLFAVSTSNSIAVTVIVPPGIPTGLRIIR